MRLSPHPHEVREVVERVMESLGVDVYALEGLDETILIEEGRYMARSYRVDGMMAMWLVEIGIVQFYDAEGGMLRTINLLEESEPLRVAA